LPEKERITLFFYRGIGNMEMRYCMHCGHKLDEKYLMGEGMVP
jgi:hypothetical protein